MVDWHSEEVVELTMYCFSQVTIFLLGLYAWYLILSVHTVEFGLITRRIRFQPAYIPYLLGRYAALAALIAVVVVSAMPQRNHTEAISKTSGQGLVRLVSVLGDVSVSAASCNLALRAMALWRETRTIFYGLICASVLDFAFAIIVGAQAVSVQCDPNHDRCIVGIVPSARGGVIGFFFFTIFFDVTILVMTITGIRRKELPPDSPLISALFSQGVGYVTITLLTCIPMGVMALLQLNDAMNVFFLPTGCTISVIASSASVTALFAVNPVEQSHANIRYPSISLQVRRPDGLPFSHKTVNRLSTVVDLSDPRNSDDVDNGDPRLSRQNQSCGKAEQLSV